jgi:hypothetical protein
VPFLGRSRYGENARFADRQVPNAIPAEVPRHRADRCWRHPTPLAGPNRQAYDVSLPCAVLVYDASIFTRSAIDRAILRHSLPYVCGRYGRDPTVSVVLICIDISCYLAHDAIFVAKLGSIWMLRNAVSDAKDEPPPRGAQRDASGLDYSFSPLAGRQELKQGLEWHSRSSTIG